jgi:hypothetical protein
MGEFGQKWAKMGQKSGHLLREPGTPPVADSTVGMANTPSAMIVLSMMIVAMILAQSARKTAWE